MKKITVFCLVLCLLAALVPAVSLADDTGALSEGELGAWVDEVLKATIGREPLNAPVGEESRTEDGYAFIYDFATLYYDKPVLDQSSVLGAISVTDESCAALRGVRLGSDEDALLSTFGWLNPYLMGDGSFAAFYCVDSLPDAAYWSWGQHDENWQMTNMQCAVHVRVGEDAYTDAVVAFTLENGAVAGIRVSGLSRMIAGEAVRTNLDAVRNVEAAAGEGAMKEHGAEGYAVRNDAAMFSAEDLAFGALDYRTMDAGTLEEALGQPPQSTETANQRMTATWADAYCISGSNGAEVLSISTSAIAGPRGIRVGDALEAVLSLFYSDGEGRTEGSFALLYGDSAALPNATLETGDVTTLSYSAAANGHNVTLSLTFTEGKLQEWVIYSW